MGKDIWDGKEPIGHDIWQRAVDRGPGLPMYNAKNGERLMEKSEATFSVDIVDQHGQLLAQLQRIEDMLTNLTSVVELVLEKSTIRPSDHQHG